jgi:hypothetical protein
MIAYDRRERQLVGLKNPLLGLVDWSVNIVGSDGEKRIPGQRSPGVECHRDLAVNVLGFEIVSVHYMHENRVDIQPISP